MNNETTLIQALQNAKTKDQAFRKLISDYKERLYWHIRKIVISHDDADDVLQNTFIKVFRNIDKFKGESKLYSWIYRIATNEAVSFINQKTKQKNISNQEYFQQVSEQLTDDQWFSGDEIQYILQKAIATLPQKQQLVFNMKYFDNMKYEEISEILETSVGGLKASYHHAVKKIELFIKEHSSNL